MIYRRAFEDGRTVTVQRIGADSWECRVDGEPDAWCIGTPLNSTLAAALGYHVAHDEWPAWIDRWAEEIVATTER